MKPWTDSGPEAGENGEIWLPIRGTNRKFMRFLHRNGPWAMPAREGEWFKTVKQVLVEM